MSYIRPFPYKKHTFFYSVHIFARIRQHCFSKYWGDGCMGRPPISNFGGPSPSPLWVSAPDWGTDAWAVPHLKFFDWTVPQSLLSLRPCCQSTNSYACLHTDTGLYERFT